MKEMNVKNNERGWIIAEDKKFMENSITKERLSIFEYAVNKFRKGEVTRIRDEYAEAMHPKFVSTHTKVINNGIRLGTLYSTKASNEFILRINSLDNHNYDDYFIVMVPGSTLIVHDEKATSIIPNNKETMKEYNRRRDNFHNKILSNNPPAIDAVPLNPFKVSEKCANERVCDSLSTELRSIKNYSKSQQIMLGLRIIEFGKTFRLNVDDAYKSGMMYSASENLNTGAMFKNYLAELVIILIDAYAKIK